MFRSRKNLLLEQKYVQSDVEKMLNILLRETSKLQNIWLSFVLRN